MSSIQLSIQVRKRLKLGYKNCIALCTDAGPNTAVPSEDVEPFAALNEPIFWSISLYERNCKKDCDFISGIKYICNTMKHCDEIFQICSFCHSRINRSVKVDDAPIGPIFREVDIKPNLLFGKIEDIPIYNKNQREQYIQLIQRKPIPEIMDELDRLLTELYPSDLWNSL